MSTPIGPSALEPNWRERVARETREALAQSTAAPDEPNKSDAIKRFILDENLNVQTWKLEKTDATPFDPASLPAARIEAERNARLSNLMRTPPPWSAEASTNAAIIASRTAKREIAKVKRISVERLTLERVTPSDEDV